MASAKEDAALDAAYEYVWNDYLHNRVLLAERRASPFLEELLPSVLATKLSSCTTDEKLDAHANRLINVADMAHIAGAVRGDTELLRQAIVVYDSHLKLCPNNLNARRMRAETFLRLHQYDKAFFAFDEMYQNSLTHSRDEAEVAPFQLIMYAECLEDAVRLGASQSFLKDASQWRELASLLTETNPDGTHRRAIGSLKPRERSLLGSSFGKPLVLPPLKDDTPIKALNPEINWAEVEHLYATDRVVVIDELFNPAALARLQSYMRHGANFRSMRHGYLGAFPSDGVTHPLILSAAHELEIAAPRIFDNHRLALWWLFKYDATNSEGIGIHADPAAVNINIWLTEEEACLEGGGLAVYSHVPPLNTATIEHNREYADGAEEKLREELKASGSVRMIPYKCNRAAIFVSDQLHESLPFRFAEGYHNRRCNLTLLFGDRWKQDGVNVRDSTQMVSSNMTSAAISTSADAAPAKASDSAWDFFD